MARKRKQVAVYLSKEIAKRLCKTVPRGKRSKFVEKILTSAIEDLKERYGKNWVKGYFKERELREAFEF